MTLLSLCLSNLRLRLSDWWYAQRPMQMSRSWQSKAWKVE